MQDEDNAAAVGARQARLGKADAPWPTPEVDRPSMDELEQGALDGVCQASDGCDVEPDGICPHGHPSWLLRLGFI